MGSYRNDHAFAKANLILNGYDLNEHKSIPWSMLTIDRDTDAIEIKNNLLVIRNKGFANVTARQNIHVMDKKFLVSDEFKSFVSEICNEPT